MADRNRVVADRNRVVADRNRVVTGPNVAPGRVGTLGILCLETRIERILGDIGHPDSFDHPVIRRVVRGATVERVLVTQDEGLVDLFAAEAEALVAAGATAITTSCGFMARHHRALAERIAVPFAASPLCLLASLQEEYGAVGVITARAATLGEEHFTACGAQPPAAVAGLEQSAAFMAAIVDQDGPLDPDRICADTVQQAVRVRSEHPQLRAILLECTNLPPYRLAVEEATGLPVFDCLTMVEQLMAGTLATLSG